MFCELVRIDGGAHDEPHTYAKCFQAQADGVGWDGFQVWREKLNFGREFGHCFDCGLSQKMCPKPEVGGTCEYMDIMLPGIYILYQKRFLVNAVEGVGFQGDYQKDLWEWMQGDAEGFGAVVETNWIKTWREVCVIFLQMRKEVRGHPDL